MAARFAVSVDTVLFRLGGLDRNGGVTVKHCL
jgi:hypothetical protein